MDLDAYFRRIDYAGSRRPTLATLRALQLAHVRAVPFENLDVLLGRRISLEPDAIFHKIVRERRGGYCFEQNSLFRDVLRALGFNVTPLLARVRWQVPAEVKTPLTHMVLRVQADGGAWLADAGFGGVGAIEPLSFDQRGAQANTHDTRRLARRGDLIVHQVRFGGGAWQDVYVLRTEEPAPMDFEMGNLFSCTHPKAHFVNNLVVTRVRPDGRVIIFNQDFTRRDLRGSATTRPIASPRELRMLLREEFGLVLPAGCRLELPGASWTH